MWFLVQIPCYFFALKLTHFRLTGNIPYCMVKIFKFLIWFNIPDIHSLYSIAIYGQCRFYNISCSAADAAKSNSN